MSYKGPCGVRDQTEVSDKQGKCCDPCIVSTAQCPDFKGKKTNQDIAWAFVRHAGPGLEGRETGWGQLSPEPSKVCSAGWWPSIAASLSFPLSMLQKVEF